MDTIRRSRLSGPPAGSVATGRGAVVRAQSCFHVGVVVHLDLADAEPSRVDSSGSLRPTYCRSAPVPNVLAAATATKSGCFFAIGFSGRLTRAIYPLASAAFKTSRVLESAASISSNRNTPPSS